MMRAGTTVHHPIIGRAFARRSGAAEVKVHLRTSGELRCYEHAIDANHGSPGSNASSTSTAGPPEAVTLLVTTKGAIVRAGLEISRIGHFRFAPEVLIGQAAPQILGAALLRDDTAK